MAISAIGSVPWMINEVIDVTYFNMIVYAGPLVTRVGGNPITYGTWVNSTVQNETSGMYPTNTLPTVTTTAVLPYSFTNPGVQTFEFPL